MREPEDNSQRPHPIPFLVVRWLCRLAVVAVVLGFAWTMFSSSKQLRDSVPASPAPVVPAEIGGMAELRKQLAKLEQEEAALWNRAGVLGEVIRRRALENGGGEVTSPVADELLAQMKGRVVQAEIRRDRLREIVAELEAEITDLKPPAEK